MKKEYKVPIGARKIKAHLTYTVKSDNEAEAEAEAEAKVEVEVEVEVEAEAKVEVEVEAEAEVSDNNDLEIVVESFKTTIKIQRPTPAGARKIAHELNQLPEIKGFTKWSPDQNGTMISIIGRFNETSIEKIVRPLVFEIMVEFRGDKE